MFPSHYNPNPVLKEILQIMDTRTKTILMWSGVAILVLGGIAMLFLSFGGADDPAVEVDAIYTNAAATVAAQQQTLQAGTLVATPTPTISSPTATPPSLLSPTPQLQTPAQLLPTIRPTTGPAASLCDNAVYVSDVTIPDGTTIPAGQSFTKTWKVSNTGTCAWTATYQLTFVSGDSLGGKATAINQVVAPGAVADISVILTSSSATGNITGTWKLTNDKGQQFGDSLTVVIKNGAGTTGTPSTPTITPTPTVTPVVVVVTATFSPTPTSTPVIAAPTETPTPTPTSTNTGG
jgi:hypothetical protein